MSEREAGRKLDAEIAEKVMGWPQWKNCESGDWEGDVNVTLFAAWDDHVGVYEPEDDGDESFWFAPSTNIQSAWLVVERMRERGWFVSIGNYRDSYSVAFDNYSRTSNAQAVSCAEAICHAALAALRDTDDRSGDA